MNIRKTKISLAETHPEIAKEWHPTKNGNLTPQSVTYGSNKYAFWICNENHEYKTKICHRTSGSRCSFCFGKSLPYEKTLAFKRPDLIQEWHPTKNEILNPLNFHASSSKKVWWLCSLDNKHEWQATIDNRNRGNKCPYCSNKKTYLKNSLLNKNPELLNEWHPTKNLHLNPSDLVAGSNKKIWWICSEGHEWNTRCVKRTGIEKTGCPFCAGNKIIPDKSLSTVHPQLAKEWHPKKNLSLTPLDVSPGSNKKVWWQCLIDPKHEWQAVIYNRIRENSLGCPLCNSGWTIEKIRSFVLSIIPHLNNLDPVQLYTFLEQNDGLLSSQGKGRFFLQALKTGKFPKDELEKFAMNKPSAVDAFIAKNNLTIEEQNQNNDLLQQVSEDIISYNEQDLPLIETKDILNSIDNKIKLFSSDAETVEFIIKSEAAKIWRHMFVNESAAHAQLEQYQDEGEYAKEVKKLFIDGYHGAKNLTIPIGYSFHSKPNLMQRYVAYLVQTEKRIGNWSGTGSGKTISAILASRVINAHLTVICTPNNVIDNWKRQIHATYPDSLIYTKESLFSIKNTNDRHQYLILNYEFFQQPNSETKLKKLINMVTIDFIIIDEIHYSRQKKAEQVSKRKMLITAFLSEASSKNNNLRVLGMSATPVINNLFEGKTMIELITGVEHKDLNTKITVNNCIALYKKFVIHGVREMPKYKYKVNQVIEEIDCSSEIPEIKKHKTIPELEAILTKAKLPSILKHLRPKTIVYTFYRQGIECILQNAIEQHGWKTAFFNGESKEGLDSFIEGDTDILIASSCIGTGIDRLQTVCNRLIINCLPWTHAEFEQLKGRIYRQGQIKDEIDVIIPITYADINGIKWSWCDSKWKRVNFKRDIASAAVDGVIPEGHLRTPEQAHKDIMQMLARLDKGELCSIDRQKINIHLRVKIQPTTKRSLSDLGKMNLKINKETSNQTHERFISNRQEWDEYHEVYREVRKKWEVIPYQEAIKYCLARPHKIIGDFGCGEAFLTKELPNKVHSFDHIAINENVIACDISHVPLNDSTLDIVIFSLSLMGTNFIDYLREAKRCLNLDGHLWIAEPTSKITDVNLFKELLERIGFDVSSIQIKGPFTFIIAVKTQRDANEFALQYIDHKNILD